jgi:hypothetical protein
MLMRSWTSRRRNSVSSEGATSISFFGGLEGQAGSVREHIDHVVETIAEARRTNSAADPAPAH